MDRWRAFFTGLGTDIWTIIDEAIILAATDYPKEFKDRRSHIAEILFARRLLELHSSDINATRFSASVVINAANLEERDVTNDGYEPDHIGVKLRTKEDDHLHIYDEADALDEETEEDTSVIKELYRIKAALMDANQSEENLLEMLDKLQHLQVTFEALQATKIGKQVNGLRKHYSKQVRDNVRQLVSGWRDLVDEWVKKAGDATDVATVFTGGPDKEPPKTEGKGLLSTPLQENDLFPESTTSFNMSQPPKMSRFMDEDMSIGYGETTKKEDHFIHSSERNSNGFMQSSRNFQSRNMLKDSSNANAQSGNQQEHKRETRADFDIPGRIERRPDQSQLRNSPSQIETEYNLRGPGICFYGNNTGRLGNQKSIVTEDTQTIQKPEITKRKNNAGHLLVENVKKHRNVQIVDRFNVPKEGISPGKIRSAGQDRPVFQNWHWSQNRR